MLKLVFNRNISHDQPINFLCSFYLSFLDNIKKDYLKLIIFKIIIKYKEHVKIIKGILVCGVNNK
jgi:hypothetical protein